MGTKNINDWMQMTLYVDDPNRHIP